MLPGGIVSCNFHCSKANEFATVTAVLKIFLRVVEQVLRERSPEAAPKSRLGAVSFVHRFGSALNEHLHFHCCVIDGVFEPEQGGDEAVRFREAVLTDADTQRVQVLVRQRVLRWFVRHGYLDKDDAKEMGQWNNGGGFSVDASVRIEANDRAGLERLLRYCARPPFALERLQSIDAHRADLSFDQAAPGWQYRADAHPTGAYPAAGGADSASSWSSSPLPWGIGAECHVACRGHGVGPGDIE